MNGTETRFAGLNANRALVALTTVIITYFSIVATFTNTRVSQIEARVEMQSERTNDVERNVAVILEKIRNIESLLVMMRDEMRAHFSKAKAEPDFYGNGNRNYQESLYGKHQADTRRQDDRR